MRPYLPTMPVSYPKRKPEVQMKKPKKYALKAPSLVPGSFAMSGGIEPVV